MTVERGVQGVRYSEELVLGLLRPAAELQARGPSTGPGCALALVQAFVNTFWDLKRGEAEVFRGPSALADGCPPTSCDPLERASAATISAVLSMFARVCARCCSSTTATRRSNAVERLNLALAGRGLYVQLDASGRPEFKAARRDLDAALATIATIVALAQLDGRWSHLKACPGEQCGWTFYDHSRNQAGNWCAMSICGSRAKSPRLPAQAEAHVKRLLGTVVASGIARIGAAVHSNTSPITKSGLSESVERVR